MSVTGWSVQYASRHRQYAGRSPRSPGRSRPAAAISSRRPAQPAASLRPRPTRRDDQHVGHGRQGRIGAEQHPAHSVCGATCAGTPTVRDFVGFGTTANNFEGAGRAPAPSTTTSVSRGTSDRHRQQQRRLHRGRRPDAGEQGRLRGPADAQLPRRARSPIGTVQGNGSDQPLRRRDGHRRGHRRRRPAGRAASTASSCRTPATATTATSDGVFVFSRYPVALGDQVTVSGKVDGVQRPHGADRARSSPAPAPAPCPTAAALPLPSTDAQREAFEGMLVAPAAALTVTEVFNLNRYGEIPLAAGRSADQPDRGRRARARGRGGRRGQRRAHDRPRRRPHARTSSAAGEAPPYLTLDDPVRVGDTAQLSRGAQLRLRPVAAPAGRRHRGRQHVRRDQPPSGRPGPRRRRPADRRLQRAELLRRLPVASSATTPAARPRRRARRAAGEDRHRDHDAERRRHHAARDRELRRPDAGHPRTARSRPCSPRSTGRTGTTGTTSRPTRTPT